MSRPAPHGHAYRARLVVTGLVVASAWMLAAPGGVLGVSAGPVMRLGGAGEGADPALSAVALLRLAGLGACIYLAGVLALASLADLVRSRRLARLSVRATPTALRRWLLGSASLGLVGGVIAVPTSAGAAPVAQVERSYASERLPEDTAETTAVMVKLAETEEEEETWVVAPGDSFWSIAEEVLAGADVSTRELTTYWQRLIDANRDRLARPDNPDLLFPDQELIIPEP